MSSSNPAPMPEEQAREAINRWAAAGFYRLRNMGDKIFVNQISPGCAYTVRLQTHYEERTISRAQEPYHGGAVDDRGRPPKAWDIQVRKPGEFQERTETVAVPHTERVQMCGRCNGDGRVVCMLCQGSGRTICPTCTGTGIRREQIMEPGREPRVVERPCNCVGGRITCLTCSGNGRQTCSACRGSGQVKTYERLVVRFLNSRYGDIFDVTPVPDGWFGRLSGEVLVDERGPRVEEAPPVNAEVNSRARKLLDRSHDVDEGKTRILLQHLKIERIPLQEVSYTYAGKELKLWLCGNENEVYAPNAPWNRVRLMWTILASVGVGVLVVVGLVYLLFMMR